MAPTRTGGRRQSTPCITNIALVYRTVRSIASSGTTDGTGVPGRPCAARNAVTSRAMKNALPVALSLVTPSSVFVLPTFYAFVYREDEATPHGAGEAA